MRRTPRPPAPLTIGAAYVGSADPQLAALGSYGGPVRTMAPNPRQPGDRRGDGPGHDDDRPARLQPRDATADLGAVETQATTVTVDNVVTPFSATTRNVAASGSLTPARGATAPGTFTFSAGAAGSANVIPTSGSVSATMSVPGNTAAGLYTLTGSLPASPGFAAGSGTGQFRILNPPYVSRT